MSENTIIRTEKGSGKPYFTNARATPQNRNLSWEARGVMWYLLSKPDDWEVQNEDLQQGCGRDKVRSILKELQEAGYLEVVEKRDDKGMFYYERLVHEIPINPPTEKPSPDESNTDSSESHPVTENPLTGKPSTANPTQQNRELTELENLQNRDSNTDSHGDAVPFEAAPNEGVKPAPASEPTTPFKKIVVTGMPTEVRVVPEGKPSLDSQSELERLLCATSGANSLTETQRDDLTKPLDAFQGHTKITIPSRIELYDTDPAFKDFVQSKITYLQNQMPKDSKAKVSRTKIVNAINMMERTYGWLAFKAQWKPPKAAPVERAPVVMQDPFAALPPLPPVVIPDGGLRI